MFILAFFVLFNSQKYFGIRLARCRLVTHTQKLVKCFPLNWKANANEWNKTQSTSENVIHCQCKHKQILFHILNQGSEVCRFWHCHAKVFNQNTKIQFHHLSNKVMNTFWVMLFCHLTYIHQAYEKKKLHSSFMIFTNPMKNSLMWIHKMGKKKGRISSTDYDGDYSWHVFFHAFKRWNGLNRVVTHNFIFGLIFSNEIISIWREILLNGHAFKCNKFELEHHISIKLIDFQIESVICWSEIFLNSEYRFTFRMCEIKLKLFVAMEQPLKTGFFDRVKGI